MQQPLAIVKNEVLTQERLSSLLLEVNRGGGAVATDDLLVGHIEPASAVTSDALIPLTALVVDDVATSRKMLSMLLKAHGVICQGAGDGLECLEAVRISDNINHFDIIFMDNTMPKMNGVEATRRLREMKFSNMIVGVTGNSMDEDLLEFSNCGADLVLTKPMTRACLVTLLKVSNLLLSSLPHTACTSLIPPTSPPLPAPAAVRAHIGRQEPAGSQAAIQRPGKAHDDAGHEREGLGR